MIETGINGEFLKTLTILYVEDEDDVFEQVARLLGKRCSTLLTARNGLEGLEIYKTHSPDIIITDINMPVMDGLTMAEQIHDIDSAVPIIVMTAFEKVSLLKQAISIGVQTYLTKPVSRNELSTKLINCANRLKVEYDLKKSNEALRKLEYAVTQCASAVVITDSHGVIEFVNNGYSKLTGYSTEELVGKTPRMLKSENTPTAIYASLWSDITSGQAWSGELRNRRKDGTDFWVTTIISPIYENGVIAHYIATQEDVTEHKKLEAALLRAKELAEAGSKAKSEFLATISHEIRTPMNGVMGMIQILLDTNLTSEQHEFAEICRKSSEHMMNVIDDILDYASTEKYKLTQQIKDIYLNDIIKSALQTQSNAAQAKGLCLHCEIPPEVPQHLTGDPKLLLQVISEFLSNAIKFTTTGRIDFTIRVKIDQMGLVVLHFEVKDTGIGIKESDCTNIFEPFTQVDGSSTRTHDGMGIGLALCKQIAYLMGGDIGVTSEVGAGSTFWFTAMFEKRDSHETELHHTDITPDAAETATLQVTADVAPIPSAPEVTEEPHEVRILYAEDNVINQKVALNLLGKLGYHTDIAENGQAALNALATVPYDLVLMDCLMPVMDGLEATKMIRNHDSNVLNHAIPIIAVTANVLDNDREHCLSVGMNDYLAKPVKKDTLSAMLTKWLP